MVSTSVHVGRGGAGNVTSTANIHPYPATSSPAASTSSAASARSTASTETGYLPPARYTTGRGGAGNITAPFAGRAIFTFDEELRGTRAGAAPVYHVGRGGSGNAVRDLGHRASADEHGRLSGVFGRLRDSVSSRRSTASSVAS